MQETVTYLVKTRQETYRHWTYVNIITFNFKRDFCREVGGNIFL
jgi:hypothetical protein